MSDPQFPDDYYLTAKQLIDDFEGDEFTASNPATDHFECDWCSIGVAYESNARVGMYVADRVLKDGRAVSRKLNRAGKLVPLASYCEECTTRLLLFPCRGFTEVRLRFDLGADRIMRNVEITDISPRDDGVPWEPRDLAEQVMQMPFEQNALLSGFLYGPENMVTMFLSIGDGIDIRELVKYDGSYDPRLLGQARKQYDEFDKKMRAADFDRVAFRDHVRDE